MNEIKTRKIVQIESNYVGDLIALADDHTLWIDKNGYWTPLETLPDKDSQVEIDFRDAKYIGQNIENWNFNNIEDLRIMVSALQEFISKYNTDLFEDFKIPSYDNNNDQDNQTVVSDRAGRAMMVPSLIRVKI